MNRIPPALCLCWLAACAGFGTADKGEEPTPVDGDGGSAFEDVDGDGFKSDEDCDDWDAQAHPGADERCNGQDDDCDGEVDEGVLWETYTDGDGDGFGAGEVQVSCEPTEGRAFRNGDCDDEDDEISPDAAERCNGVDDDCDGQVDNGLTVPTWYRDADEDGVGVLTETRVACDAAPGWSLLTDDCDDSDPTRFPGQDEACNAADDDCDGALDEGGVCPCPVQEYDGHAYLFCRYGSDWAGAQAACTGLGYRLVTVDDAIEESWLVATAGSYGGFYWWTGANDIANEGQWTWEDGSPWVYENWCPSEPNNGHGLECVPDTEEDCGVLAWSSTGCWNDYPCTCAASQGEPYQFICEG